MSALRKIAFEYDEYVGATVVGNAIGNSIVDKTTPRASTNSVAALNKKIDSDLEEGWNNTLAGMQAELDNIAAPTLDVNPETDFTPGMVSGDEKRAASTALPSAPTSADTTTLEEVVVTGHRSSVSSQYGLSPERQQILSVYNQVLKQTGKSEEARTVAAEVASRQQLEARIANTSDPRILKELQSQYKTLSYGLMARDSYFDKSIEGLLPNGISRVTDAAALAKLRLGASDLATESGYAASVYYDSNNNEYVVANRGTEASWADAGADFTQAQGLGSAQYRDAVVVANNIQRAQRAGMFDGSVVFTGHSLGGGLAAAQALRTGYSATTFNAAGLNADTIKQYGLNREYASRINAYSVTGEVLSFAQDTQWPRLALATTGILGAGVALAADLPRAVGQRNFLPAISLPTLSSAGQLVPGQPLGLSTSTHHLALHGMDYALSSMFYKANRVGQ